MLLHPAGKRTGKDGLHVTTSAAGGVKAMHAGADGEGEGVREREEEWKEDSGTAREGGTGGGGGQVRDESAEGGAVNKRGDGVCAEGGGGGGKGLGRRGGGLPHLSIPLPPHPIRSLSLHPPLPLLHPHPPRSLFVTASPSGSVEPGIVHLIRSLMHF